MKPSFKWHIKTPLAVFTCPHCGKLVKAGLQMRVFTDSANMKAWKVVKATAYKFKKKGEEECPQAVEDETQSGN